MTRLALAAAFIGGISTTGAGQPVAIHMGSGPPNAAYEARYKLPESRMALNDPLNRTGFVGGPIPREDVAHGTTE
jgi:hypothetical protein